MKEKAKKKRSETDKSERPEFERMGKAPPESEMRLYRSLDNLLEGCQIIGFDWTYLYVNNSVVNHSRLTKDELLGHTMMEVYPGIEKTEMFAALRRCMDERTPCRMENEFHYPDGSSAWFDLSIQPIPEGVFILSIDVTERKLAEDALHESEEKYRSMIVDLSEGFYSVALDGTLLDHNREFNRILGFDPGKNLIGIQLPDFWQEPADRNAYLEEFKKSGRIKNYPIAAKKKNGERILVEANSRVVVDRQGQPTHIEGSFIDVTERERAEEIIKHSALELEIRNRIAEVFLTIPDEDMYNEVLSIILDTMESKHGVFGYLDEKGDLVVPTMTRTVWKKCQVPDKSILFPRETWGDTSWSHAIREKRTICLNEPSTRIPEGHIAIERHISMPLIHQGEVIGLIQVANKKTAYTPEGIALLETIGGAIAPVLDARLERERQGTARRLAEEELRKHHDHLEELVQERTRELEEAQEELVRKERLAVLGQLAGGVSHELRNPLGAIKNAAYLINMVIEHPEPEVKESLEMINREVAKSDRIITSILDYARPKPPAVQAVNVNQLLGDALSPGIVPDNIETVIRLDESLPLVMADPEQMARVFSNLILNAVQAMPEGGRLTVSSAAADDKVAVSVEDSGAGIPKENLDKIFEPLFSTRAKGIGLGLAIARDMMERNGGSIEVHSEEGKGSTFSVKLPLAGEQG